MAAEPPGSLPGTLLGTLIDGQTLLPVELSAALAGVQPGDVVVIGEKHYTKIGQAQELAVMAALRAAGLKVSVGLEFLPYTAEDAVNAWRAGTLDEPAFLRATQFGEGFEFYRAQAQFPAADAYLLGLNAPRALTRRIAEVGTDGLTLAENLLMPPHFTLGNANYRDRFVAVMGGVHVVPPAAMDRFFAAQSTWDDTMAWQAARFLAHRRDQVLAIVVGEFHVRYGGGLPDRLRARTRGEVWTISLLDTSPLNPGERQAELAPSPVYGSRADFLFTSP
jgi:uncharacterized iron-regulated protein